jgi:hypothetical protein
MSNDDSINLRQDRRQWLKTSATMLGASLLPLPAVGTETTETQAPPAPHAQVAETKPSVRRTAIPAARRPPRSLTSSISTCGKPWTMLKRRSGAKGSD